MVNTFVGYGRSASTTGSGSGTHGSSGGGGGSSGGGGGSPWLSCQDHILWGLLVTAVFLTFSVRLGAALSQAHAKRMAAAATGGGGSLGGMSKKKN